MTPTKHTHEGVPIEIERTDDGAYTWRALLTPGGRVGVAGYQTSALALDAAKGHIDRASKASKDRDSSKVQKRPK